MSTPTNNQHSGQQNSGKTSVVKATEAARKAGTVAKDQSRKAFDKGVQWAGQRSPATLAWGGIALAAIVLLMTNLLAGTWFKNWRADLTEDGIYTISDSTRKVLSGIDEPINVQLYFTKALGEQAPQFAAYFQRVRALLERYRDLSAGKLRLEFISPEAFSDAEDRAVGSGLRGIRLNAEGDMAYFGLVATNTTDNVETVGFFTTDRERYLEYDLTKLIHTLSKPKKKVLGLIAGLPLEGAPGNPMMGGRPMPPWAIIGQIKDFFELKTLPEDLKEVPADVETLMLVQPTGLTPQAAYAIDQFVLKGGRLLVFVDPVAEVARMLSGGRPTGEPKELEKLLAAWGVKYDPKKVAADVATARRVQYGGGPGGAEPSVAQYVAWLSMDRKALDESSALTGGVETLNVASMGIVEVADKATVKLTPILQTSERAMVIDAEKISLQPNPIELLRNYQPGGKRLTVAARVSGDIKTAFPNGLPKPEDDKKAGGEAAKAGGGKAGDTKPEGAKANAAKASDPKAPQQLTSGKINAIVVADSDLLHDQFWVDERDFLGQRIAIPTAHNAVLVVNAIENLTGGEALRDLRGRGVKPRPFTVVDEIRREAERKFHKEQQTLETKLKEVQTKLAGIEQKGEGGKVILSDKDRETIEKFRVEMLGIRRQLREVKHNMRRDIDRLDTTLKFVNIAAVPLLIGLGALGLALMRRRSDRVARNTATPQT